MKVVLAHGVFDILHIGHLEHLQEAKMYGDWLIVSITAARFVTKRPNCPVYTDDERLRMLQALRCVDAVYLSQEATGVSAIRELRPAYYAKGIDYTERALAIVEQDACAAVGTKIVYTKARKRSSLDFQGKLCESL